MARHNNSNVRSNFAGNTIADRVDNRSAAIQQYRAQQAAQAAEKAQMRQSAVDQMRQRHIEQRDLALELLKAEKKNVLTSQLYKELGKVKRDESLTDDEKAIKKSELEHSSAHVIRIASAVIDNFVDATPNKEAGVSKVSAARITTEAQVPVSVWEKHSDEQGTPLAGNDIDKGLRLGVKMLVCAGKQLYPTQGSSRNS